MYDLSQILNHCKQYLGESFGLVVKSAKHIFFDDRFVFQNFQNSNTFKNGTPGDYIKISPIRVNSRTLPPGLKQY